MWVISEGFVDAQYRKHNRIRFFMAKAAQVGHSILALKRVALTFVRARRRCTKRVSMQYREELRELGVGLMQIGLQLYA